MPAKSTMRDNVSAVRSRLPDLSNLPRETIEFVLHYYESNVDETVEAFKLNGALEALSGWEMSNSRGHNSNKRTNNKPNNKSVASNVALRPSQRVSNLFQNFAKGNTPAVKTNGNAISSSNTEDISSYEQLNDSLQTYTSTNLSFQSCLSQDSAISNSPLLLNTTELIEDTFHEASDLIKPDETNTVTNHIDEVNGHSGKSKRRRNIKSHNDSISVNQEQNQQSSSNDVQQSMNNSSSINQSSSSSSTVTFNDNRKLLKKSTKDLQRQTSTLTNVELSFENEIKSSEKHIDETFKQIRDIIREREVQLYLEIDKVKEQGLNIIRHRQQRATELRQRVDRCDRLEPLELDNLRTDIKHFVSERRYDLSEELTSTHRFQYDQSILDALKNFGTVLRIDRKYERARTLSSTLAEHNSTTIDNLAQENSVDNIQTISNDIRVKSSNEDNQQPLPQRAPKKLNFNMNNDDQHHENIHSTTSTNGFLNYYDDSSSYQKRNRRHPPQQQQQQQQQKYQLNYNENNYRSRPTPSNNNTNNNHNNRRNGFNNSETKAFRRQPQPSQFTTSPTTNS